MLAYCHLLIVTAYVRRAFDDSEPIAELTEAKFYDMVWQTLDLVGYLTKLKGQGAPKGPLRTAIREGQAACDA